MLFNLSFAELIKTIPAILIGLTVHELAHSYVALLLGDNTAKMLGRLTLNPIKHIDRIGFFLLLVAGFGGGETGSHKQRESKTPKKR